MVDSITNNDTIRALNIALNGLSSQQEMIGQNLANVDTPGYHAQTVDFKSALRQVIQDRNKIRLVTTNPTHLASSTVSTPIQVSLRKGGTERADGNNVDIDTELTQMTETYIQYQAMSQLVSKKLAGLKYIISGR
jgi:flagellar basal-body rod protein FlgB